MCSHPGLTTKSKINSNVRRLDDLPKNTISLDSNDIPVFSNETGIIEKPVFKAALEKINKSYPECSTLEFVNQCIEDEDTFCSGSFPIEAEVTSRPSDHFTLINHQGCPIEVTNFKVSNSRNIGDNSGSAFTNVGRFQCGREFAVFMNVSPKENCEPHKYTYSFNWHYQIFKIQNYRTKNWTYSHPACELVREKSWENTRESQGAIGWYSYTTDFGGSVSDNISFPAVQNADCEEECTQDGPEDTPVACPIENGTGTKIRQCTDGNTWGEYEACFVESCDAGMVQVGNQCLVDSTGTNDPETASGWGECTRAVGEYRSFGTLVHFEDQQCSKNYATGVTLVASAVMNTVEHDDGGTSKSFSYNVPFNELWERNEGGAAFESTSSARDLRCVLNGQTDIESNSPSAYQLCLDDAWTRFNSIFNLPYTMR